ncbi:hypothetical protein [Streptomyces sp.]
MAAVAAAVDTATGLAHGYAALAVIPAAGALVVLITTGHRTPARAGGP